jgi:H+-translocating NAD(P) transhydrogenase subunit alpha
VAHQGKITWPPPKPKTDPSAVAKTQAKAPAKPAAAAEPAKEKSGVLRNAVLGMLAAAALCAIGLSAPPAFLAHFTVFVLAVFVGYMVVWNVTPALHTPLMSVTNAISGIIVIGAMLQISGGGWTSWVATIAVLLASINVFGGFLVTRRMLKMFRK